MQTLAKIKQQVESQDLRVAGCGHAISYCYDSVKQQGLNLLKKPASLAVSFAAGWWFARLPGRPKNIKQAKNVTIKRSSYSFQLFKSLLPFFLSEFYSATASSSADAMATTNSEDPNFESLDTPNSHTVHD